MERIHDDLDALNLITSSDIGKVYEGQDTEDPLVLRQKAKSFRNGYKNWRMKKPKGATGEVTNLTETQPKMAGGVVAGAIRQAPVAELVGATSSTNELAVLTRLASQQALHSMGAHMGGQPHELALPEDREAELPELGASVLSPAGSFRHVPIETLSLKGVRSRSGTAEAAASVDRSRNETLDDDQVDIAYITFDFEDEITTKVEHDLNISQSRHGAAGPQAAPVDSLSHHELLGDKRKQSWLKFMVNPYSSAAAVDESISGAQPLSQMNLGRLPLIDELPRYERKADHWICHLGVGGFHRSHQANYLHLLLQQQHKERIKRRLRASQNPDAPPPPPEPRWGFCGVGLMEWDKKMYDTLSRQNHLFTLVSRGHGGSRASVVGSIMDFVYAPADRAASVARLADPSTHLVSLTITEKGYCQNVQGELDQENSLIKHDLETPTLPCSAIGLITEALRVRRAAGRPPFTVLSCDNLPMNGSKTKRTILQYCELVYPDLVPFMQSEVCFPNTMVDRITPVTEPEHIEICKLDYGVEDGWPVFAEEFMQWVIEDSFNGPRPAWEALPGVLVVPDVHSYEWMKLRLLNGTHSALSYPSYLSGFRFVDDSLRDQLLGSFVKKYMDEVTHTVPPVPGVDLGAYKTALFDRFSNPYIKDKLMRLAEDGSQKLVTTMRDPMLELAAQGKPIKHLAAAIACFLKFTTGYDLQGQPIEGIKDPRLEELKGPCLEAVSSSGDPVATAIVCGMVFGDDVKHSEACISAISGALKLLVEEGIEALLASLLEEA